MKIKFIKNFNIKDISIKLINNTHPNSDTKLSILIIWILLNFNEDLIDLIIKINLYPNEDESI